MAQRALCRLCVQGCRPREEQVSAGRSEAVRTTGACSDGAAQVTQPFPASPCLCGRCLPVQRSRSLAHSCTWFPTSPTFTGQKASPVRTEVLGLSEPGRRQILQPGRSLLDSSSFCRWRAAGINPPLLTPNRSAEPIKNHLKSTQLKQTPLRTTRVEPPW